MVGSARVLATTRAYARRRFTVPLVAGCLAVAGASLPAQAAVAGSAQDAGLRAASARYSTTVRGWPQRLPAARTGAPVAVSVGVASRGGGAGRTVVLQRYQPTAAAWTNVLRSRTGSRALVVLRWAAPASAGTYRYRLRVLATPHASATVTRVSALTVTRTTVTMASRLVRAVNVARSQARRCGTQHFPAVAPVAANASLQRAAARYAGRMAHERFFAHVSPMGDDPGDRIAATGYAARGWGEDIAAGQDGVSQVMTAWLASPGHCAIIMSRFHDLGAGYANVAGSPYGRYWVLDFGSR